ncbi:hypothetical protein Pcinc_038984 [Petrolisthes cinctipes]|uniref:Secreted protein n=1 Tax=Petrolisthes cinctipes TaxID=88211 RepID=A0AAE1BSD3_PETCI|nr:hypothetical protein Pcinc_038984 [Petrolisthes cinctipes]
MSRARRCSCKPSCLLLSLPPSLATPTMILLPPVHAHTDTPTHPCSHLTRPLTHTSSPGTSTHTYFPWHAHSHILPLARLLTHTPPDTPTHTYFLPWHAHSTHASPATPCHPRPLPH